MNVFKDYDKKCQRVIEECINELGGWTLEGLTNEYLEQSIIRILTIAKTRQYTRVLIDSVRHADRFDYHERNEMYGYAQEMMARYFESTNSKDGRVPTDINNSISNEPVVISHLYSFFKELLSYINEYNYSCHESFTADLKTCITILESKSNYGHMETIYKYSQKYIHPKDKGKIIRNV